MSDDDTITITTNSNRDTIVVGDTMYAPDASDCGFTIGTGTTANWWDLNTNTPFTIQTDNDAESSITLDGVVLRKENLQEILDLLDFVKEHPDFAEDFRAHRAQRRLGEENG